MKMMAAPKKNKEVEKACQSMGKAMEMMHSMKEIKKMPVKKDMRKKGRR